MTNKGLLLKLDVRAGQDAEMTAVLQDTLSLVRKESKTTAWFAVRFDKLEYGIFDVFPDEESREAHLQGPAVDSLRALIGTLLTEEPHIHKMDILAEKLPKANGLLDTQALLLTFKAREGYEENAEQFLHEAKPLADAEASTTAWFALRFKRGHYGIFDVFPEKSSRFKHIFGKIPRELIKHAVEFLGDIPHLDMLEVKAEKLPDPSKAQAE